MASSFSRPNRGFVRVHRRSPSAVLGVTSVVFMVLAGCRGELVQSGSAPTSTASRPTTTGVSQDPLHVERHHDNRTDIHRHHRCSDDNHDGGPSHHDHHDASPHHRVDGRGTIAHYCA